MIEQLQLFNLDKVSADFRERIYGNEPDNAFPWIDPNILAEKIQPSKPHRKIPQQPEYTVFLGVFSSLSVTNFIKSFPRQVKAGFKDIEQNSNSCYASIKINENGLLIGDSLQCAAAPWALKKVKEILVGNKNLSIDNWTNDFYSHVSGLQEAFNRKAVAFSASEHKVTVTDFNSPDRF